MQATMARPSALTKLTTLVAVFLAAASITCSAQERAARSSIAITLPQAGTFTIGQPIKIEWQATNIPGGASLVLYAVTTDGASRDSAGEPLTLESIQLTNGPGSFAWDGKSAGNDATGKPMLRKILPGNYHFVAKAYDRGHVWIFPPRPGWHRENPKVIAIARSADFILRDAEK